MSSDKTWLRYAMITVNPAPHGCLRWSDCVDDGKRLLLGYWSDVIAKVVQPDLGPVDLLAKMTTRGLATLITVRREHD